MQKKNGMRARRTGTSTTVLAIVVCAIGWIAMPPLAGQSHDKSTNTFVRIRLGDPIRLGFRTDARPFSYTDSTGRPAGFAVALCERIAAAAKQELGVGVLPVEWVRMPAGDARFQTLRQGNIDVICAGETETLARREDASFSIPIFPGGIGVIVRADATRLRDVLSGRPQLSHPIWRAAATAALRARAFSISDASSERWLAERMKELDVIAQVTRVESYDAGIQAVVERHSDAFFGERSVLLNAARRSSHTRNLVVLDRVFTYETLALPIRRGDDAFRLLVDRALSQIYASGEIVPLYANVFGEPDESTLTFFQRNALR